MDSLLQDLRYAGRSLLRTPSMTATAVLTLALGIGANTALFSLINGVFLEPDPAVGNPEEVRWISEVTNEYGFAYAAGISYPVFETLRQRSDLLDGIAISMTTSVSFAAGGDPAEVRAEVASGDYFSVLRITPALGRGFLAEEDAVPGRDPVVVLSHALWQSRLGGRSDVLGSEVKINGTQFTVVGVAPEGFRGTRDMERPADLWVPVMMYPVVLPGREDPLGPELGVRRFLAVARLSDGVAEGEVEAVMNAALRGMAEEHPRAYGDVTGRLYPFRGAMGPREESNAALVLLFATGITLVVLLIACGNVANLLLARAAARRKEIAIRAAVGASRWRIVRQLLVESLLLATLGGAGAVLVASLMIDLFLAAAPIPFPVPASIGLPVLLATAGLACGTGVLVGLSPALRSSRADVTADLKGTVGHGAGSVRPQTVLVSGQLALSCMLLVAAVLLGRAMWNVVSVDLRQPARDEVVALSFDPTLHGYEGAEVAELRRRVLENARAVPGVEAATVVSMLPHELQLMSLAFLDETGSRSDEGFEQIWAHYVHPGYFRTTGLRVLRGRELRPTDREGAPLAVVVNESAANRFWPGQDPLGKRLRLNSDTVPWSTVVGVVVDAGYDYTDDGTPRAAVYRSDLQTGWDRGAATLLARTRGDAMRLQGPLTEAIRAVEPDLPVSRVRTLGQIIDAGHAEGWVVTGLMVAMGTLALGLALIGLHGIVAYTVERRTREVGIRLALGASRAQILGLFTGEVVRFGTAGVAVGIALAAGLAAVLGSMIAELDPLDPLAFGGVAALLLLVAVAASYLPARRATGVDPMVALRAE